LPITPPLALAEGIDAADAPAILDLRPRRAAEADPRAEAKRLQCSHALIGTDAAPL
jgi:hypothetical protein